MFQRIKDMRHIHNFPAIVLCIQLPIFLFPVYLVSSLRFVMMRDRNDRQTNISSSVMPSWASSRTALAMVAQCSAVSKTFGVGVTSFCLLSFGFLVRTIQPRFSSPSVRRLTLDFSRYSRSPGCPWVMVSPLSSMRMAPRYPA